MRSRAPGDGNISPWCVPRRQSAPIFSLHASPKGASDGKSAPSWQHIAAMNPKRAGFGKICAPCIRKALQIAFQEYTARRSCQEGALFAALTPQIIHGALILPGSPHRTDPPESCTARESCHSWVFRLGVVGEVRGEAGRGVPAQRMRLARPPLCARQRGVFAGSPHAASSCPRPRARCSCCRARPRVRRARCPPPE